MSPLKNLPFDWNDEDDEGRLGKAKFGGRERGGKCRIYGEKEGGSVFGGCDSMSASSSRSSSPGRSSKRWVFLKDFLGSKSEGRSNKKFWATISFSPAKEKRPSPNNAGPKEKNGDPADGIRGSAPKKGGGLVSKGGSQRS